ncbi:MAG: sialate O-acetylesterase [Verrucomicrobiales bacterium]|nr:sialate O-acetylesterase [Verrucomicrobiales bacterium]
MKNSIVPLLLAMVCFTTWIHATDVYIVIGQSNGWRISSLAEGPGGEQLGEVMYFPMACTSRPESSQAKIIKMVHPSCQGRGLAENLLKQSGDDIIFVQYCVCGSSLHGEANWYPGNDPAKGEINEAGLYANFQKYLASARKQAEAAGHEWDVKGVFWHQGESDSNAHSAQYETNFRNLIYRLRKDVGPEVPIVAGKIRELSEPAGVVNQALETVASSDPLISVVPVDDLPAESPTNVHFKTPGCQTLGARMVEAYSKIRAALPE